MFSWKHKRNEPRDRHREFIYLDAVSVISLLASLEGEVKESITNTLSRTADQSIKGSLGSAQTGASAESRFGTSRTSTNEVVRRAVIQSTFRDLWRRDVGVLLHNMYGNRRKIRKPIRSRSHLEKSLHRLEKAKIATPLSGIHRGDIVELDIDVKADILFEFITAGATLLDIISEREDLFGIPPAQVDEIEPIIEVLKETLVGLVPMRGVATSHSVIEVAGQQVAIATEILGEELLTDAKPLELVGFAEADSFWRDLRRTLFSGATYTVYARAEGPTLASPWSPIKIADLFESFSPGLRNKVFEPLQQLDFDRTKLIEKFNAEDVAKFQLENFAAALEEETAAPPDVASVNQAIESAIPLLASATTIVERRRAFEPVVRAVAGEAVNRDTVYEIRSNWIDQTPSSAPNSSEDVQQQPNPDVTSVQLEVEFVALYW